MPIIVAAKSLFSLPTTSDFWVPEAVKAVFQRGWPRFPSPKLEFQLPGKQRRGTRHEWQRRATEKVKEAMVKSLDKSKATEEDSAKSAAEAVDETVKKLKRTLSGKGEEGVAAEHSELRTQKAVFNWDRKKGVVCVYM